MQQVQWVWPQEERQVSRHFFVLVLFSSCVHHLLECPGFICLGFTWYLLVVVLMLPIPQHGVFKDPPSFVTIYTLQGLVVKFTCMQDCRRRISPACIGRDLPLQLSTVYVCTTWRLNPKALALLPGFCIAVPLLPVLKTWLVQGLA